MKAVRTKKITDCMSVAVSGVLFIYVLWIMVVCISKPSDNLLSIPMAAGTIVVTLAILSISYFFIHIFSKNNRLNSIFFIAGTATYICLLFVVGCIYRYPDSMHDVTIVKAAAEDLINNRSTEVAWYFESQRQNFKMVLLLSYLIRVSNLLRIDVYYIELCLSVLLVLLNVFAVRYLSGRDKEERDRYQCVVLLLFVAFLPTICFVQMIYTDMYSFGLGIISIALFKYSIGCIETKKRKGYLGGVLSGLCLVMAYSIKITSIIPVIAFFIMYVIQIKKKILPILGISIVTVLITSAIFSFDANRYELYKMSENKASPIIHWIALGLVGDGSWTENEEYGRAILEQSTTEEKKEFAIEYIKENISEFTNINHHIAKTRTNFASGTANIKQVVGVSGEENIIHNVFGYTGKYYWRMCQLSFVYMFALWLIILCGALINIINVVRRHETDCLLSAAQLLIVGMVMFIMLWESSGRQTYNQMPGMFLCVMCSVKTICKSILDIINKCKCNKSEV